MPYTATVLPAMIASPSDVLEYRAIARDVLHEWNYVHSLATGVVLMPVGWETHSSPDLGAPAQEQINERILEHCDLLIAVFWTRLGTPTSQAKSGSAEEIQRHVASGKPAMVYFSRAPAALETVERPQYNALLEFRSWCATQGLIEYVDNPTDFQWKLRRQLQITLNESKYIERALGKEAASLLPVEPSLDAKGRPSIAWLAGLLHDESRHLLLEASNRDTIIQYTKLVSGPLVECNGVAILSPKDPDGETLWQHMLSQLQDHGLITTVGQPAPRLHDYTLTSLGRTVAGFVRDGMK